MNRYLKVFGESIGPDVDILPVDDLESEIDELLDEEDDELLEDEDDELGYAAPWSDDVVQHLQQGDPQWWPEEYQTWEAESIDPDLVDLEADELEEEGDEESVYGAMENDEFGLFLPLSVLATAALGKRLGQKGMERVLRAIPYFSTKRLVRISRNPFRRARIRKAARAEVSTRRAGTSRQRNPASWPGGAVTEDYESEVEYEWVWVPGRGRVQRPVPRSVRRPRRRLMRRPAAPPTAGPASVPITRRRPIKRLQRRLLRPKDAHETAQRVSPVREKALERQRAVQARAEHRRRRLARQAAQRAQARQQQRRPRTLVETIAPVTARPKRQPMTRPKRQPMTRPKPARRPFFRSPLRAGVRVGEDELMGSMGMEPTDIVIRPPAGFDLKPKLTSAMWGHPFQSMLVVGAAYGVGAVIGSERTFDFFEGIWGATGGKIIGGSSIY